MANKVVIFSCLNGYTSKDYSDVVKMGGIFLGQQFMEDDDVTIDVPFSRRLVKKAISMPNGRLHVDLFPVYKHFESEKFMCCTRYNGIKTREGMIEWLIKRRGLDLDELGERTRTMYMAYFRTNVRYVVDMFYDRRDNPENLYDLHICNTPELKREFHSLCKKERYDITDWLVCLSGYRYA